MINFERENVTSMYYKGPRGRKPLGPNPGLKVLLKDPHKSYGVEQVGIMVRLERLLGRASFPNKSIKNFTKNCLLKIDPIDIWFQ